MKNTFKLLLLFMGGLTALIVIAMSGFIIINKNKTYYIYDVRFVQPVEDLKGYVYTEPDIKGESMEVDDLVTIKSTTVYMNSEANNLFPIAVYAATSTNTTDVSIKSSDPTVAKVVLLDGKCYVKYLKEGLVTITTGVGGVEDSFVLKIIDSVPSEFQVFDNAYYGEEYVNLFPNSIVGYADGLDYRYSYTLQDAAGSDDIEKIDGDLIRIDESNLDTDVFSSVKIDSLNRELIVNCKVPEDALTENINSTIVLQSFVYGKDGKIIIQDSYIVSVFVFLEIPEFLQVEVSGSPDFDEGYVFTSSSKIDISSYTNEQILANPSLLDEYLSAEKAENYLAARGEQATYNVNFTNKVSKLYVRFRTVYTNGKVEYLVNGENADFVMSDESFCSLAPMDNYYIMNLSTSNYFVDSGSGYNDYVVKVSLKNYSFEFDFAFKYFELNDANIEQFYNYDTESKIYTYKYWDLRTKYANEVCDTDGNVVGFGA